MREYFRDGVDRRVKPKVPYSKPRLETIPITKAQVDEITGSFSPKTALRAFARAHFGSDRSRG